MDRPGFDALLDRLAAAWAVPDPAAAADCFTVDAIYMEPPDRQLFVGRDQLLAYFSPLAPGTYLRFHHRAFDEPSQVGMAEWTFGVEGRDVADTGVSVIETRRGLIAVWREYHVKGPARWDRFVAIDDTEWEWHVGNYP